MKIVIITGASRGLGHSAALQCAARGMGVIVTYNSHPEGAEAVVREIEAGGGTAAALKLDVGQVGTFAAFKEAVAQTLRVVWGRADFDGLVNNAGYGLFKPITAVTEEQFDGLFNVHLKGPFFLTQTLLPLMADGADIVNLTSATTRVATAGVAPYTGRMAATNAQKAGMTIVLAGRPQDEPKLIALAKELGVEYRLFAATDPAAVQTALAGIGVLLNCAGPFMHTAEPLMRACIATGVHYLDIAAELDSYQLAETLDAEAVAAGVMLLPGSGGSVAMLGSLAGHAAKRVGKPQKISIALHVAGGFSRGSAVSASENMTASLLHRVDGVLVNRSSDDVRDFDFGSGRATSFPVTLPDLITIWRATNIPNIETFVHLTDGVFPEGDLSAMPDGPTLEQREVNRYYAAVEVIAQNGTVVRSIMDTVNGYTFTTLAAAEAARRVANGEARPGFQTPAGLFGDGFAETIADTTIVDL